MKKDVKVRCVYTVTHANTNVTEHTLFHNCKRMFVTPVFDKNYFKRLGTKTFGVKAVLSEIDIVEQ